MSIDEIDLLKPEFNLQTDGLICRKFEFNMIRKNVNSICRRVKIIKAEFYLQISEFNLQTDELDLQKFGGTIK